MTAPHAPISSPDPDPRPVTVFGPDFPFPYDDWVRSPLGLGRIPPERHGEEVAIVGAGIAGVAAAYELMRMGVKPVIYEPGRIGGRLRSEPFQSAPGIIAELGGMRFPVSGTAFYHYVDLLGLDSAPFPNPLSPASPSTVIDLEGITHYVGNPGGPAARLPGDRPRLARRRSRKVPASPPSSAHIRARDVPALKEHLEPAHPDLGRPQLLRFRRDLPCLRRTILPPSRDVRPGRLRHRRMGFRLSELDARNPSRRGRPTAMRTSAMSSAAWSRCPAAYGRRTPERAALADRHVARTLHDGAPRPAVIAIRRSPGGTFRRHRPLGHHAHLCRRARDLPELASHHPDADRRGSLFARRLWMALDRTRYMQSAKTFVMVDRPFWKDKDPGTGRDTDEHDAHRPADARHLSFRQRRRPARASSACPIRWMSDALKMLPLPVDKRVRLALDALQENLSRRSISRATSSAIRSPFPGKPTRISSAPSRAPCPATTATITACTAISCRTSCRPPSGASSLPATTSPGRRAGSRARSRPRLNAVWGIMHHLGGRTAAGNPGPGDRFADLAPLDLGD